MTLHKGRFAPSPTGRMHLGNIAAALQSWLSVKRKGGEWLLRIEDLDPQRSKAEYARQIEDDLHWLGLDWDEGGVDSVGNVGPYCQSQRNEIYGKALDFLENKGLLYNCVCTRADLRATQAPHTSDGVPVYSGVCRPKSLPYPPITEGKAVRIVVPDREISFTDLRYGLQTTNLARSCGDFVLRRADGAWAYQLAVVVDDIAMGVTEIVRGDDLLDSTFRQLYLYSLFGAEAPTYEHIPLLRNEQGIRLSKRDASMSLEELSRTHTPQEIIGRVAYLAGIIPQYSPVSPAELL